MWKILEKRPFFQVDTAGLGNIARADMAGLGSIGLKSHIELFAVSVHLICIRLNCQRKTKKLRCDIYSQEHYYIRIAYRNHTLPVVQHDMITRGNDGAIFILPLPRIKSLRKCPFYWCSQIWNLLPYDIHTTDSKKQYKRFMGFFDRY